MTVINRKRSHFMVCGCQGSNTPPMNVPTYNPETDRFERKCIPHEFGVCNTCLLVVDYGTKTAIMFDAGDGTANAIPTLNKLLKQGLITQIFVCMTHYHDDHMNGWTGLLKLLFGKKIVRVYLPQFRKGVKAVDEFETVARRFDDRNSPVTPHLPHVSFDPVNGVLVDLPAGITIQPLVGIHPGGSVLYKITTSDGLVRVIATDNQPTSGTYQQLAELFSGTDLVYFDGQFTQDEVNGLVWIGDEQPVVRLDQWGHGTIEDSIAIVPLMTKPPRIFVVGHHDPARPDEDLHLLESRYHHEFPDMNLVFAREGNSY